MTQPREALSLLTRMQHTGGCRETPLASCYCRARIPCAGTASQHLAKDTKATLTARLLLLHKAGRDLHRMVLCNRAVYNKAGPKEKHLEGVAHEALPIEGDEVVG